MRINRKVRIMMIICVNIILLCMIATRITLNKKQKVEKTTTTTATTMTTTTTTTTATTTRKTTKRKTTKKVVRVATASYNEYQQYAQQIGGYDEKQMTCLIKLWNRESGWNPNARNKKSGACGIPQALPCKKIKDQQGSNDWKAQIRWGINYIKNRYKTPCNAWQDFKMKGWY